MLCLCGYMCLSASICAVRFWNYPAEVEDFISQPWGENTHKMNFQTTPVEIFLLDTIFIHRILSGLTGGKAISSRPALFSFLQLQMYYLAYQQCFWGHNPAEKLLGKQSQSFRIDCFQSLCELIKAEACIRGHFSSFILKA